MVAGRCQHHYHIDGFALHHAIHVIVMRNAELLADNAGILRFQVTHRSQAHTLDLIVSEQFRVTLGNAPATDYCNV